MNISIALMKASNYHRTGRLEAAHAIYQSILSREPDHPDALHLSGVIAHQFGDHEKARELIKKAIHINPDNPSYYNNLGTVFRSVDDIESAKSYYRKTLSLDPEYSEAWYNLGTLNHTAGGLDAAVSCYRRALQHDPQYIDALNNLAAAYNSLGKPAEAITCCQIIIALKPDYAQAYNNLGNALKNNSRLHQAAQCYRKVIDLKPDQSESYNNLANLNMDMGNIAAAVQLYGKAIDLDPDFPDAHNGLGTALQSLGKPKEALASFERFVSLRSNGFQGYHNMGNAYLEMSDFVKALSCYEKAIEIKPDQPEPYLSMGFTYRDMGRPGYEYRSYEKALKVDPECSKSNSHMVHYLMQACDWSRLEPYKEKINRQTRLALDGGNKPAEMPFLNIARTDDLELNFRLSQSWSAEIEKQCSALAIRPDRAGIALGKTTSSKRPITIGYLSNNFKNHPTAHLTAGIFGYHDRTRFKVHCYSYGENDHSSYRQKIQQTSDRFVDIRDMGHLSAARQIADDAVDILIDLVGFMKDHRLQIPALRPAPIQVRWLGMAGTTGAGFFDYILTHPLVTPEHHAPYYAETFAYLPDCYQVNDRLQKISDQRITRQEMQLPPDAFVFCCFCTAYKINPDIFRAWMNILKRIPNGVLWLLGGNGQVKDNLIRFARSQDVDGSRLIFAEKISKARHLKRLQLADLALDTTAVNGAATTSDALWAGIPVITKMGQHFASRMSGCILSAIGMSDMVMRDLDAYESLAVLLASRPNMLKRTKAKLDLNRFTQPLFDTRLFVRYLESAYQMMWASHLQGEKPCQFHVHRRCSRL